MNNDLRKVYIHFLNYDNISSTKLEAVDFSKAIAKNPVEAEFVYLYYSQPSIQEIIQTLPFRKQNEIWRYVLLGCIKYDIKINSRVGLKGKELKMPNIEKIIDKAVIW